MKNGPRGQGAKGPTTTRAIALAAVLGALLGCRKPTASEAPAPPASSTPVDRVLPGELAEGTATARAGGAHAGRAVAAPRPEPRRPAARSYAPPVTIDFDAHSG